MALNDEISARASATVRPLIAADIIDADDDGDGVPTSEEGVIDHDLDGIPDYLDDDSDNDGTKDGGETLDDVDCDGLADRYDDTDDMLCNTGSDEVEDSGLPWPKDPECGCANTGSGGAEVGLLLGLLALLRRR